MNRSAFLQLYFYLTLMFLAVIYLPKGLAIYHDNRTAIVGLAALGIWRYGWWSIHVIRSIIYRYLVFPRRRLKADQLWASGWRPKRLFFMMTTFKERQATTEKVLQSILDECNEINVPIKLFIGTGSSSDEEIINAFMSQAQIRFPLDLVLVRQSLPGKRFAIGETLRAIQRSGLEQEDCVIFMDGDTYFTPGCLRQCLPFFPLYPKMQALTTFEQAVLLNGPTWMKKWLDMRFAQRDLTMQSHALSNKILTLTGRMSIFRGKHLLEPEFIAIIEYDHLTHWLWGKYRFLSGDDKSTWYYLLKSRADMFYIPDVTTVTIEYVQGSAIDRMKENLRRWSGNTLRNGARAIALGPQKVGYFIWWCLIDQRIAIWTMPIGITITLILAFTKTPMILFANVIWIAFSRLCLSTVLFWHARKIDMTFPFLLYFNQFMNSLIKIHILFRLPQQRWKNRGDQQLGFNSNQYDQLRNWVASYLTLFYCTGILLLILLYLDLIDMPTVADIHVLLNLG